MTSVWKIILQAWLVIALADNKDVASTIVELAGVIPLRSCMAILKFRLECSSSS